MLSFLIFLSSCTLTPNDIFKDEWDIHVGTIQSPELTIPYTLEFHLNHTSERTISTLWRNGDVATEYLKTIDDPMLAQFEISFDSPTQRSQPNANKFAVDQFVGTIFISNEEIPFQFKELENGNIESTIQYKAKNLRISIVIYYNETILFTIKPFNSNDDNDNPINFLAIRPQPLNHVDIQRIFKEHDEIKKEMQTLNTETMNWSSPASVIKFAYLHSKRFYRQYRHFILFGLIIIGIQVFSYLFISCIKRICAKGVKETDDAKEIQARKKKDDDYHNEEEQEGDDVNEVQQTEEEEKNETRETE